ncbi:MAG: ABC transporter substrate-binding protein [Defluviitaleaceae bacterium]|nr:ABC transporter substrate-binding protein [Defluviitaleaceae bacterium]MCL2262869.1 ABC transporter substrate-binding protein [Defluviitaleaceae bacterium]
MKKYFLAVLTILMIAGFVGCGVTQTVEQPPVAVREPIETTDAETPPTDAPAIAEQDAEPETPFEPATVRVAAMRGPTAMGLLHLMHEAENGTARNNYEFELLGSPDLVPPLLVQGEIDIAAVPGNLAAVLYNRLDVQALAVVTLGVLHIVDTTDTIHSIEDLRGRTIYTHGQGITPEIALNYVLEQNGLTPGEDVFVEFRAEHAEIAALLETGQAEIALLPEPFVSTVLARVDGLRVALDLSEEWDRVQPDYGLIMSVVIARREFLEQNPQAVAVFLEEYAASVAYVNANVPSAAQLAVDFDLIPALPIAQSAIPRSNIVFITGNEMRQNLIGFYNVLYNANPETVGGAMPSDDFWFND